MNFFSDVVLNGVDASTNQTSGSIKASLTVLASVQAVVSGTAVGTLKLQASNDITNATNWSDVPSASVAISGAGTYLIPKTELCHSFIRVVYTSTSGVGTLSATLAVKNY